MSCYICSEYATGSTSSCDSLEWLITLLLLLLVYYTVVERQQTAVCVYINLVSMTIFTYKLVT